MYPKKDYIFPFYGRDKRLGQHIEELMLLFISGMFHFMHFFYHVAYLCRIELPHPLVQELSRLARIIGAGNKVIKIKYRKDMRW